MKANIAWDDTAELWNCLTCGARWLRMAISRCRCNGVLDGMLGQVKARDLIPGWPRGRSTSRPLAAKSAWPWQYVHSPVTGEVIAIVERDELRGLKRWPADSKTLHLDHAAKLEDRIGQQAEERRKSEMMECWYWIERSAARGSFYPEPIDQQIINSYALPLMRFLP